MSIMYEKHRSTEYQFELENEFKRLKIAKDSFHQILTPREFKFNGETLFTEKIGAGASSLFKQKYPPEHFVKEYLCIVSELWNEKLNVRADLTPEWIRNPKLKDSRKLHPDFSGKTKVELLEILSRRPICNDEDNCVVHGDLCPVNIIFDGNGRAVGLIDLGDMHMGNKMLDIAVLSWTIRGNFGREYENMFLKELAVNPNNKDMEYYRLIYDLSLPDYKKWNWIKE